jgi:signal transduction histidine kinase
MPRVRLPRLDDRGVAVAYLAVGLLLFRAGIAGSGPAAEGAAAGWLHAALLATACAALVAKRRHPVAVLAVACAANAAAVPLGGSIGLLLVLVDALYTAALQLSHRGRRVLTGVVAVLVVAAPVAAVLAGDGLRAALAAALQAVALLVTPVWWGSEVRAKSDLAASEARRAELERAQAALARTHAADVARIADLDREAAVRGERTAMARDLHDVVASRLSAIAIHAEAALAGPPDPAAGRTALGAVRSEALASLAEMRSMILVLRGVGGGGDAGADGRADLDGPDARTAASGLDRLDELVATARERGLDVHVDLGPAAEPATPLPAVVDHAAYRIAHEALTNAAAHGPAGGRVDVRVTTGPAQVEIEVLSALASADRPAAPRSPALGSATGLLTMSERARSLGGRLSAGPDDGRWRVHALLPRTPEGL